MPEPLSSLSPRFKAHEVGVPCKYTKVSVWIPTELSLYTGKQGKRIGGYRGTGRDPPRAKVRGGSKET